MRFASVVLAVTLLACACGGGPSVEEQIRARIDAAVEAAESRDLPALQGCLSADYRDGRDRDRRAMNELLALYLRANESIHVFTRIRRLSRLNAASAEASLLVAMTGRPVRDAAELGRIEAELYRVDVRFALESGGWKVTAAEWEPASRFDFL